MPESPLGSNIGRQTVHAWDSHAAQNQAPVSAKNMTDAIGGHSHLYMLGASHKVALLLSTSFDAAYASDNLEKS